MSEPLERLLWQEVDGELDADQRQTLSTRLASGEGSARRLEDSVRRLSNELAALPLDEPPPELRARITRALEGARPPRRSPSRSPLALLSGLFQPPLVSKLAVLGTGVVLGVLGYHLLHSSWMDERPLDHRQLYGTMRPAEPPTDATLALELADGAGSLAAYRIGDSIALELSVEPGHRIELALRSRTVLRLERFAPEQGWSGRIEARDPGSFRVTALGPGHHRLALQPGQTGEPMELVVTGGGAVLTRHRLHLGNETNFPAPSRY